MDRAATVIISCLLIHVFNTMAVANPDHLDMSHFLTWGKGLNESVVWKMVTKRVFDCARLCVRLTQCKSITYDEQSKVCELNERLMSETGTRNGSTLAYSEYTSWPTEVNDY